MKFYGIYIRWIFCTANTVIFQNFGAVFAISRQTIKLNLTVRVAANLKMKRLLEEKFPHIVYIHCAAHCIQLVVGDVMKVEPFAGAFKHSKRVIKSLKKKQNAKKLRNVQEGAGKKPLSKL